MPKPVPCIPATSRKRTGRPGGRLILQNLVKPDKRRKFNYKNRSIDTKYFINVYNNLEKRCFDNPSDGSKANVRRALSSLKRKGLIKKYRNPSKRARSSYWDSAYWECTEDGLKEVKQLNENFQKDYLSLRKKYGKQY